MIEREYWDFRPEWLDYVKRVWKQTGGRNARVQQQYADDPERLAFAKRAGKAFSGIGVPFRHVKTYVSIQVPVNGDGYDIDYPHIHYPLNATTLVHYLQPGDKPAPLHIFDGDEVVEEIFPEVGLTVFMPNNLKHGVLKNQGTEDRIQMIATAIQ